MKRMDEMASWHHGMMMIKMIEEGGGCLFPPGLH